MTDKLTAEEQLKKFKELVGENLTGMNMMNMGTWHPSLSDWQRIYEKAFLDFLEAYKNQSAVSESNVGGMKWVKASDRLPESNASVLYHTKYNILHFGSKVSCKGTARYFNGNWIFGFDANSISDVEWLNESIPSEVKEKDLDSGDKATI